MMRQIAIAGLTALEWLLAAVTYLYERAWVVGAGIALAVIWIVAKDSTPSDRWDFATAVLLIGGGFLTICVAWWWLKRAIYITIQMFAWCAHFHIVGIIIFVALWVFLFPVTLGVVLFLALFVKKNDMEALWDF